MDVLDELRVGNLDLDSLAPLLLSAFWPKVFNTVIPRNVRLGESPSFGKPVLLYDIDSAGSRGYLQLAQELLRRNGQGGAELTASGAPSS